MFEKHSIKYSKVYSTVNASVKDPVSDDMLARIILSGEMDKKHTTHLYAFFLEVPVQVIAEFASEFKIPIGTLKCYYEKYIQPLYTNKELERFFLYE